MSDLIELHNVAKLLGETERPNLGLRSCMVTEAVPGVPRAIIKFAPFSVCEVFGYQIADAIGVRVPQMWGFWTQEAIQRGSH